MPSWKQRIVRSKEGMNVVAAPVLDQNENVYIILVIIRAIRTMKCYCMIIGCTSKQSLVMVVTTQAECYV